MNRFMVILIFIAISFSPAFAGNDDNRDRRDRNGDASAFSKAEAEANVDVRVESTNKNNNENTNINKPTFSVETGPVSVTGGSNSVTANPVVNANPTVTTTTSISNVVEAPKIAAQPPGIPESAGTTPQIFWDKPTMPANALSTRMIIEYLKACKPRHKSGDKTKTIVKKGASGLTEITFTPFPQYAREASAQGVGDVSVAMPPDSAYRDRFACIGTMQAQAIPKHAGKSNFDVLTDDAAIFGAENFKGGYPEVYLITVEDVIAVNLGVSNRGGGFGIAPALSDLAGDTFRGVGGVWSGNKGDTFAAAQLGTTFLVLAKPKDGEEGVDFNIGSLLTLPVHSPVRK